MLRGARKSYLKGSRRHHWGGYFNIERWLRSRVGRPWSDVHSELSAEFDRRTYAGQRFWETFNKWYVAENCWVGAVTGRIFTNDRWSPGEVDGFYVHPWTGILQHQARIIGPPIVKPVTHIPINDRSWLDKIDGIWYWIEQYEVHTEGWTDVKPSWGKHAERVIEGITFYQVKDIERIYHKKQLSHDMLKRNNLTNDSPEEIKEALRIQTEKDKFERQLWKRQQAARHEQMLEALAKSAAKAKAAREAQTNAANL